MDPQTPIRRAVQRDEAAIERCAPSLARTGGAGPERAPGAGLVDESGFYLLPGWSRPMPEADPCSGEADPRPLSSWRHDAGGRSTTWAAGVAERDAQHRVPRAPGPRGGEAAAGDLGRLPIHAGLRPLGSSRHARRGPSGGHPGYARLTMGRRGWNHLKHVEMRNLVCRDLESCTSSSPGRRARRTSPFDPVVLRSGRLRIET